MTSRASKLQAARGGEALNGAFLTGILIGMQAGRGAPGQKWWKVAVARTLSVYPN